jgi:pimeloyl-ACP methyl ester carboxylesterase
VPTETVTFPGARPPDRRRTVVSHGVRLAVYEWGDPDALPLALAHGGFDFARTFDVFAPLLADAGWRVVAWDQRGHGASEHTAMYSWEADLRDALAVIDSVTAGPLPVVGHSKGGSVMVQFAAALPHRVSSLVNLDGVPSGRSMPDVPDHERTKLLAGELAGWLDFRRQTATKQRRPDTIDGLAQRRGRMNPRLSKEWLRYLVSVGARHDDEGWRWMIDPSLRLGGFGPWRPEWAMSRLPGLSVPMLAVLGQQPELMGWATPADEVAPNLPEGSRLVVYEDVGHFVHIEQPQRVADLVIEFLAGKGSPIRSPRPQPAAPSGDDDGARHDDPAPCPPTVTVRNNRIDVALHRLGGGLDGNGGDGESPDGDSEGDRPDGDGDGAARPLLLLHGLGERSPDVVPDHLAPWPGPVWALDFTGHGSTTVPAGGGYFCELLMSDVDAALGHVGPATLHGRGLGAYVALLIAGARPDLVRGAVLDDGPGLAGGGSEPTTSFVLGPSLGPCAVPDPYALLELSHDVRPPDYAATYARQAATLSGLDTAIVVSAIVRPPWLAAVAAEPGVRTLPRARALTPFLPA